MYDVSRFYLCWAICSYLAIRSAVRNALHRFCHGRKATSASNTTAYETQRWLLSRLKPERPVWRVNWALRPTPRLDLTSRHSPWVERLKAGRGLDDCWLRLERQTLSRLPRSGAVLFTIHTYQERVAALTPEQRELAAAVVRSTPAAMRAYKGIAFLAE